MRTIILTGGAGFIGSALVRQLLEDSDVHVVNFDPSSPYAASKAAADHLVRAWHRTYGLPALITACCNNYGPRQYPEKLIPLVILNALDGRALPLYGWTARVRSPEYRQWMARQYPAVVPSA